MFYKYTLNKDKSITEEAIQEYDGILNKVIENVFISEVERFDGEIEMLFELFKED